MAETGRRSRRLAQSGDSGLGGTGLTATENAPTTDSATQNATTLIPPSADTAGKNPNQSSQEQAGPPDEGGLRVQRTPAPTAQAPVPATQVFEFQPILPSPATAMPPDSFAPAMSPTFQTSGDPNPQLAMNSSSSGNHTGAIVGGVVGGLVGLLLICAIVFLGYMREKRKPSGTGRGHRRGMQRMNSDSANGNSQGGGSLATGVDAIFRAPRLPSDRAKRARAANGAKIPLMDDVSPGGEYNLAGGKDISALEGEAGRKLDLRALKGTSKHKLVALQSGGGTCSLYFPGEETKDPSEGTILSGHTADSWKLDVSNLQCKMQDGQPVRLGKGGNGSVFLGVLVTTPVAIRVVETPGPQDLDLFHKELEIMRACHHPNLLAFLGSHMQPEKTFLLFEYCSEGNLHGCLRRDAARQLGWFGRGQGIALDVARGLTYMHRRSLMHLEVRSPNILLNMTDDTLEAKIMDSLGSRSAGPDSSHVRWCSPEQLLRAQCDSASDIFSFGIVLWELCSGEEPAQNRHFRPLIVPKEAPQAIADLIAQCLQAEPQMRPTALHVHAEIRRQTY